MAYFTKQPYAALRSAYAAGGEQTTPLAHLPDYARQVLSPFWGIALAKDFQVLSRVTLVSQHAELTGQNAGFSADWLVFAYSGQGDFWLLHKDRNETGFYDHNAADYALKEVVSLRLTLEGWVEAADLFRQFDVLPEIAPEAFTRAYALQPAYKQAFVTQLSTISPGLFERLPFTNV